MAAHKFKTCTLAIALVACLIASGCNIFDAEEGISNRETPSPPEYADLTSPQNLVNNLVLSYAYLDIEGYAALLLSDEEGDYGQEYRWYFQADDAAEIGKEYWTRQEDIEATNNLFRAASGAASNLLYPKIDDLEIRIPMYTPWFMIDSLWGEPCEDCWSIILPYFIDVDLTHDSYFGDDDVEFFIVPIDEGDVTTYRIAIMRDIHAE
jgi:hypothetical protein